MRKKKHQTTATGGQPVKKSKKKKVVPLWPENLPLDEIWYTFADLMALLKVGRTSIDRYRNMGLLRHHKWGSTLRFNKAYVDWMIQNGDIKLT